MKEKKKNENPMHKDIVIDDIGSSVERRGEGEREHERERENSLQSIFVACACMLSVFC